MVGNKYGWYGLVDGTNNLRESHTRSAEAEGVDVLEGQQHCRAVGRTSTGLMVVVGMRIEQTNVGCKGQYTT